MTENVRERMNITKGEKAIDEKTVVASFAPTAKPTKSSIKQCSPQYYNHMWKTTQIVDYVQTAVLLLTIHIMAQLLGDDVWRFYVLFPLFHVFIMVFIWHEDIMQMFFHHAIAEAKINAPRSWATFWDRNKMVSFGAVNLWLLSPMWTGILGWWTPCSMSIWWKIWRDAMLMHVLNDVFIMGTFHAITHANWFGAYAHHKRHHIAKKDLNVYNAFNFDFLDFWMEALSGPWLLTILYKYVLNVEDPRCHLASHVLELILLTNVHSNNPYCVCLFNPILDALIPSVVGHNLHHAMNKGRFSRVPYSYIFPSIRKAECDLYNNVLDTAFPFN